MKYKYLKDQNESFRKQIDEQNQLINSQAILIDKLTREKIDLLSKLEIQNINKEKRNLKIKIRIIDKLDIIAKENTSGLWNKISQRMKQFNKTESNNIGRILDYKPLVSNIYDRVNPLKEKTIIISGGYCGKTRTISQFINAFDEICLGENDEVLGVMKRATYIKEQKPKTVKPKSKDWYQKHNNKQRFQGKNK